MSKFEEINAEITAIHAKIAELREAGARAAADDGLSGHDILVWLTRNFMDPGAARRLCVTIIHERRAAREAAEVKP